MKGMEKEKEQKEEKAKHTKQPELLLLMVLVRLELLGQCWRRMKERKKDLVIRKEENGEKEKERERRMKRNEQRRCDPFDGNAEEGERERVR
jgi:hypothetical protein